MKRVELLAPAGNMEALKAAVHAGCDAVYLGLKSFSARAFAGNFSHEEFQEAIHFCHTRDVKVYCTINTMLFESEIENVKNEVAFLYENDVDAILIQDLGLFHYVRTCYPDLPIHCSTQMHIHNLKGVKMMQEEGVERVVLARETPIELIQEACKTGVEIEVFTYGAICISYSGACMMSQATKNRSANRGMCAQCCRLKYFKEDGSRFEEGDYILSPKDLNIIDELPRLLDAGVASLKIEGRMKRSEYVYLVTKTFREAIEAYYAHKPYKLTLQRKQELAFMFHRGFSNGHILHDDVKQRMSQFRPNHQGLRIGTVLDYKNGLVQVKLDYPLYQHDGLRILNTPHDTGLTAIKIYKDNKLVNHGNAGDIVWITCPKDPIPKKGQPLHKTTDTKLIASIQEEMLSHPKKTNISITYEARIDKPFHITISNGHIQQEAFSSQVCQKAIHAPITSEKIETNLTKTDTYPYEVNDIQGVLEDVFLPISILNETRREAMKKFDEAKAKHRINQGKKQYTCSLQPSKYPCKHLLVQSNTTTYFNEDTAFYTYGNHNHCVLPVIHENNNEKQVYTDVILSSVCDLYNTLDGCIAGMTMHIANSYAMAYVLQKGVAAIIFSTEMNNAQIETTLHAFLKRYGFIPKTYRLVYGKRVAMYIKDGFMKDHSIHNIKDLNANVYAIEYHDGITEIREPELYVATNPYCYGSVVILDHKSNEILEESYEEISTRI